MELDKALAIWEDRETFIECDMIDELIEAQDLVFEHKQQQLDMAISERMVLADALMIANGEKRSIDQERALSAGCEIAVRLVKEALEAKQDGD